MAQREKGSEVELSLQQIERPATLDFGAEYCHGELSTEKVHIRLNIMYSLRLAESDILLPSTAQILNRALSIPALGLQRSYFIQQPVYPLTVNPL
jgi:hypothetical protein